MLEQKQIITNNNPELLSKITEFQGFEPTNLLGVSLYLLGILLGSMLPDIDSPKSEISKILRLDKKRTNNAHRTYTHTIWACIFLLVISQILAGMLPLKIFMFGVALGYLIHILCDSFSYGGVIWTYPFTKKKIHKTAPSGASYILVWSDRYNKYVSRKKHWYNYKVDSSTMDTMFVFTNTGQYILLAILYYHLLF